MTYDELIDCITKSRDYTSKQEPNVCMKEEINALLAAVRLHKPVINALPDETCWACQDLYPCPTIQAIEKELAHSTESFDK